jgi:hypothetical protein
MQIIVVLDDHAGAQLCGWNRHAEKSPYWNWWMPAEAGRKPHAARGTLPLVSGRAANTIF